MRNLEEKIVSDLQEIKEAVKGACKPWMSLEECAKYICISKNSLYAKTARNEIPSYRIGKRIIFKTEEIDAWIQTSCKVRTTEEIEMEVSTAILTNGKDGGL